MTHADLSPDDFLTSASQAVAACAALDPAGSALRLAEDGLLGVLAPEDSGGLGLPLAFAVPVCAAAGAGLLGFPLIETLLLARLVAAQDAALAAEIVAGTALVTAGWQGTVGAKAGALSGAVGRVPFANDASHALIALDSGGAALVSLAQMGVTRDAGLGLSLEQPEGVLRFEGVPLSNAMTVGADDLARFRADAHVLMAASVLGSAEASLALAVTHVSDRKQFGKTLVSYQAMRHLLARQKLTLEGLRQAIGQAVAQETALLLHSRAAFLQAAQAGPVIAEAALQAHGGMGFTWDVPVHRHLRQIRALALRGDAPGTLAALADALIGDAA